MPPRLVIPFVAVLLAVGGCKSDYSEPSDTVGSLPEQPATTLLPEVVVSYVPDDTTPLAPDTLFGGNLCSALVAGDFASVTIAGASRGRLLDTLDIADDLCGYVVRVSGDDYTIMVRARSENEFSENGQLAEALTGIGVAAAGLAHREDDTYEVFVKVENGFFSVRTPDEASARALARLAVGRALQA